MSRSKKVLIVLLIIFLTIVSLNVYAKDDCDSSATTIDLSSFNTSKVTDMMAMFEDSEATTINLSSFNTSNVTSMISMFSRSKVRILDLSSFDTSNVTNMNTMFSVCSARTGYARTQEDADRFNNSSNKPSSLVFVPN